MNLYVFRYHGSYVDGNVIAIAPDAKTLMEMMTKEMTEEINGEKTIWYPPIADPVEAGWYNVLLNIPGHVNGMDSEEVVAAMYTVLDLYAPVEKKKEWANILRPLLENTKEHGFGDHRIRTDWALQGLKEKIKDCVYLTEVIKVYDTEIPRIVAHSCHSG